VDEREVVAMLEAARLGPEQARRILRWAARIERGLDDYDRFLLGGRTFSLPGELRTYLEEVAGAL